MDRSKLPKPVPRICTFCEYRHSETLFCKDFVENAPFGKYCSWFRQGRCITCKLYGTDRCSDPTGIYDWCGCDLYVKEETDG